MENSIVRLMKKISLLALLIVLAGCDRKPLEACPQADRRFIENSIYAYFAKVFPKVRREETVILSDEKYESYPKLWMVSVDVPDHKYIALVLCSGKVELSGRDREP